MSTTQGQSANTPANLLRLGGNHGYRLEGDTAILSAELELATGGELSAQSKQQWALQLWATNYPYEGGELLGLKVAEAQLAPFSGEARLFETSAFAYLPPAQSEFNMVLVLASGEQGRYDQVHDFSNYAERQQFVGPRLQGTVGYRFDGEGVLLQAEGVRNTRSYDNLSGSLKLELWALPQPYEGGELSGTILASTDLGRLEGQSEERFIERYAYLNRAPAGEYQLALVLTEYTSAGNVTRDVSTFATPYLVVDAPVAEGAPLAAQPAQRDVSKSEPAVAKTGEALKVAAVAAKEGTKAAVATKPTEGPEATAAATKDAEVPMVAAVAAAKEASRPSVTKDADAPKAAAVAAAKNEAPKVVGPVSAVSKDAAKVATTEEAKPAAGVAKDALGQRA